MENMSLYFGDRAHGGFSLPSSTARLPTHPWAAIIDLPQGSQREGYNKMPPLGGYTTNNPAKCIDSSTGHDVQIYFEKGRKVIRRIKKPTFEKRQLTRDEALESPDQMWLFLKQYNKKKDKLWEKEELAMLEAAADDKDIQNQ